MSHAFKVYKTDSCPYCNAAKDFLGQLQTTRSDVNVKYIDANAKRAEFQNVCKRVGRTTVPQIFLDGRHIGGWDDLHKTARDGTLDKYLETGEWVVPKKKGLFAKLFGR